MDSCQPKVSVFHIANASPLRSRGPGLSPNPKKWSLVSRFFATVKRVPFHVTGAASLCRTLPAISVTVRRSFSSTATRSLLVANPRAPAWTCTLLVRADGSTAQEASSGAALPLHMRTRRTSSRSALTCKVNSWDVAMVPVGVDCRCCAFASFAPEPSARRHAREIDVERSMVLLVSILSRC